MEGKTEGPLGGGVCVWSGCKVIIGGMKTPTWHLYGDFVEVALPPKEDTKKYRATNLEELD